MMAKLVFILHSKTLFMKHIFISLSSVFFPALNTVDANVVKNVHTVYAEAAKSEASSVLFLQQEPGVGRMRSIVFKNQEYCRAEAPDFEFEVGFKVVSATVYFTGANFKTVEKGTITSNSLKPVKPLMERCIPGTIVIFDDVKVIGPDKEVRTIPGITLQLY